MTDSECLQTVGLVVFGIPSLLFVFFRLVSILGFSKSDLDFKSELKALKKSIHNPSVSMEELDLSVKLCKSRSENSRFKTEYRLEYASLLNKAEAVIQSKVVKAPRPTLLKTANLRPERNRSSEDIDVEFTEGRECISMKQFP